MRGATVPSRDGGEGLKVRGSGGTALRIVGEGNVAGFVANAVAGTMGADVPSTNTTYDFPAKPDGIRKVPELSRTWDTLLAIFTEAGILHKPDVLIFEMLVRHLSAFRDASDELYTSGPVIQGKENEVRNPAGSEMQAQSRQLVVIMKEMGLTLVSRAKQPGTGTQAAKTEEDNPFSNAV